MCGYGGANETQTQRDSRFGGVDETQTQRDGRKKTWFGGPNETQTQRDAIQKAGFGGANENAANRGVSKPGHSAGTAKATVGSDLFWKLIRAAIKIHGFTAPLTRSTAKKAYRKVMDSRSSCSDSYADAMIDAHRLRLQSPQPQSSTCV